jgi:methylisocitrate lyase
MEARMAVRSGFQAVYQSGAVVSAGTAGVPDIGLISRSEFVDQARYLTQAVSVPVISDADTGFGGALAVERTVQQYEAAGLAGLHLEDQELPKRCGHLNGKKLIPESEMVAKIRAAVSARRDPAFVIIARTDARGVDGFDAAVSRAAAYRAAGADLIFPEALESLDEFARFSQLIRTPLLANMTEFGKGPLLSLSEFSQLGYAAVLFPVTIFRVAMKAAETALAQLAAEGTQKSFVDTMQTRSELYDLLGYANYEAREQEWLTQSGET